MAKRFQRTTNVYPGQFSGTQKTQSQGWTVIRFSTYIYIVLSLSIKRPDITKLEHVKSFNWHQLTYLQRKNIRAWHFRFRIRLSGSFTYDTSKWFSTSNKRRDHVKPAGESSGGNKQTGRRRRASSGAGIDRGLTPCKLNCISHVFCNEWTGRTISLIVIKFNNCCI